MTIIESSISINKPIEQVFEFITNLENQKILSPLISAVEVSGPLKVGLQYKVKTTVGPGLKFDSVNEVVGLEPNKRFSIKTIASGVTNTYLLDTEGSGTKLTLDMDVVVRGFGIKGTATKRYKASLDTSLALIKKALES